MNLSRDAGSLGLDREIVEGGNFRNARTPFNGRVPKLIHPNADWRDNAQARNHNCWCHLRGIPFINLFPVEKGHSMSNVNIEPSKENSG